MHDCVSNIPPANSTDHASSVQEENLQNFGTSAPFNLQYPASASTLESAANPSSTSVPSPAGVSALGSLPGDTSGAAAAANSPSPSPRTPRGPLSPSARVATSRERGGQDPLRQRRRLHSRHKQLMDPVCCPWIPRLICMDDLWNLTLWSRKLKHKMMLQCFLALAYNLAFERRSNSRMERYGMASLLQMVSLII